ncbi:hypothetical protein BCR39DRAFT_578585 [Naematelia encephala]|uniref:Uncharacterized protein n=1 Tax=Naematelia encephala TaxID=71784 RepID=A0A1Y2AVR3_9TREE|nr:hypothetical protein BCR39DRAFT_578585 [Naematelia encephala]
MYVQLQDTSSLLNLSPPLQSETSFPMRSVTVFEQGPNRPQLTVVIAPKSNQSCQLTIKTSAQYNNHPTFCSETSISFKPSKPTWTDATETMERVRNILTRIAGEPVPSQQTFDAPLKDRLQRTLGQVKDRLNHSARYPALRGAKSNLKSSLRKTMNTTVATEDSRASTSGSPWRGDTAVTSGDSRGGWIPKQALGASTGMTNCNF